MTQPDKPEPVPPSAIPTPSTRGWQIAFFVTLIALPLLTAAITYYTLPFDARRAVAGTSAFHRLPGHAWLRNVLLRRATFSRKLVLKPKEALTVQLTMTRTANMSGALHFRAGQTNAFRVKVQFEVMRGGLGPVPLGTKEVNPSDDQIGLFSERFGPGIYTFTLECEEGPPTPLRADLVLVSES